MVDSLISKPLVYQKQFKIKDTASCYKPLGKDCESSARGSGTSLPENIKYPCHTGALKIIPWQKSWSVVIQGEEST